MPRRREDVRPLPAHFRAEARAGVPQQVVRRRAAERPRRYQLAVRPRQRVVQPEDLADPVAQPAVVPVERGEPPDVDDGQVGARVAVDDPVGQRLARAARRGDADRVETGGDEEVPQLRRLAEDELVVRGEALRPVVQLLHAGRGQDRDPLDRAFHQDGEVLPVLGEQLELERVGQFVGRHPGLGIGLEPADEEPADLFLDIGVAVRVAEHGQIAVHAGDLVGDHVEVLGRMQRDGDPAHRADLLCPLARTVDHDLGLDVALVGPHPGDRAAAAGDVAAEIVINWAGQWAKQVGAMGGVTVPLHSAEHFYVVTDQISGVHRDLPVLRDPDGYTYIKEEVGGLLVGGFEPDAKPWVAPDELPYPFEFQLLAEDWEHFSVLMESAIERIPVLATTGMKKLYNGPESFTPDNQFILGEAPELRNFFVAAGFNSVGIASAGGAGKALADWITDGDPGMDLSVVDLRRFAAFNGNNRWLRDRVGEVLGLHYAPPWPNRELVTARPFRRSPAYHLLRAAGACFGSKMGWERANVFAPVLARGDDPPEPPAEGKQPVIEYSWDKPNWLPWSAAEQLATREAVAVFDQTSFSKYLLTGPAALAALQWLCTADIDVRPGRTVYTGMLNAGGRYEADITVTRLAADQFLIFSSAASTERDLDHIRRRLPAAGPALVDVTSAYSVYGVMGPRSRELLSRLSTADLGNEAFGFAQSRQIDLGYATVRATRLTYVGELGWEICVTAEFAVGVYEDLMAAGADLGVVNGGYYAIESMRLEKAYRAFGRELTPDYNPVEAGLLFACKLKTPVGFLGRDAVERARAEGPRQRLVSVVLDDQDVLAWGAS